VTGDALLCKSHRLASRLQGVFIDLLGLLNFTAGELGSRRIAARLIPRFLPRFPGEVLTAATVLTRLQQQQHVLDADFKGLQDATRQDALQGLLAVLQTAQACPGPNKEQAVKLVLGFLLR